MPALVEVPLQLGTTVMAMDNADPMQDPTEDTFTIGGTAVYGFSSYYGHCIIAQEALPWNPCSANDAPPAAGTGGGSIMRIY